MNQTNEKKTHSQLTNFLRTDLFGYLFLFLLSVVAFLPLVTRLGFYWDDWPMLWFEVTQGPEGFAAAFTGDRPFLGILYRWTGEIFSTNPLAWQLLTIFFRWLVGCAFFKALRLLWKEHDDQALWIAAIVSVYSGFKQMPIAYVWGNAFILLFAYVLSYVFMFLAIDAFRIRNIAKAIAHTALAVITYLICTLCTEYYTGLDLARLVMIWIFLRQDEKERTRSFLSQVLRSVAHWLPYLSAFIGFMVWRVFVFEFPSYQPVLMTRLQENPIQTLLGLAVSILRDAYTSTWASWSEFLRFPLTETVTSADRIFWLVVFGMTVSIFVLLLLRNGKASSEKFDSRWVFEAVIFGLSAVVLPGLPYVVTDLSPALSFPRDRWLTAYMFGSSILLVALIEFMIRSRAQKIALIALTAAFMVGGDVLNANSYARDWKMQKSFIDQLQTRIPALEDSTYFFTDFNPLMYETDNSLTGLVNLVLYPDHPAKNLELPTAVGFYDVRFERDLTPFTNGDPIFHGFRSALFSGTAENTLVYFFSPPGCLRILDPDQHLDLPIFPSSFYDLIPYSNLSRIVRDRSAARPTLVNDKIFKKPIEENWCVRFQRAELARQNEEWTAVAAIGDEALKLDRPNEASEYIPFIEAYAKTDQWQKNPDLMRAVHAMNPDLDAPLCGRLQPLLIEHPIYDTAVFDQVQIAFFDIGCSLYGD